MYLTPLRVTLDCLGYGLVSWLNLAKIKGSKTYLFLTDFTDRQLMSLLTRDIGAGTFEAHSQL